MDIFPVAIVNDRLLARTVSEGGLFCFPRLRFGLL